MSNGLWKGWFSIKLNYHTTNTKEFCIFDAPFGKSESFKDQVVNSISI